VETGDESIQLDPFGIVNMILGMNRNIAGVGLGLYCRVNNLFNKNYEVIRSFPMPGRSLLFTITLGFEKSRDKNDY
jgi:outer membrane cobalamin receptor